MSNSLRSLPISIDPCPIEQVSMEVRFTPSSPPDAVYGILYQKLKPMFPETQKLPTASIPDQIRSREERLIFQPHYKLKNPQCEFLIGPRVAAVVFNKPYPGWTRVQSQVVETFTAVAQTGILTSVDRLGLRYISFFEGDVLDQLTLQVQIDGNPVVNAHTHLKTVLGTAQCRNLLQVLNNARIGAGPNKRSGTVVDIDSASDVQPLDLGVRLVEFLNEAHGSQKALFFRLLKPELLSTLHPKYLE